jgi:hypothetical protein
VSERHLYWEFRMWCRNLFGPCVDLRHNTNGERTNQGIEWLWKCCQHFTQAALAERDREIERLTAELEICQRRLHGSGLYKMLQREMLEKLDALIEYQEAAEAAKGGKEDESL